MHPKHDRAYHLLFSEPVLVEDLLRNFVQEPWVEQLDFSGMERINAKFHAESLARRDGDIIMRIPFLEARERAIYLFLLLEFQSREDHWMALRIGTYARLLYEQLVREEKTLVDRRLPPLFPLVLYNGDTPWRAATELKQLIALPPNSPLWPYQPGMRYYLIDESQYPKGKPGSLSGFVMRLENAREPQEFMSALKELGQSVPPHMSALRRALGVWITHVMAPHRKFQLDPREIENFNEVKAMLATRIEQWEKDREEQLKREKQEARKQGEKQGQKKGQKLGQKLGQRQGEANLLSKMLERKYGPLPPWVPQRLAQADTETLEHWADNLLDAQTLDEVFK